MGGWGGPWCPVLSAEEISDLTDQVGLSGKSVGAGKAKLEGGEGRELRQRWRRLEVRVGAMLTSWLLWPPLSSTRSWTSWLDGLLCTQGALELEETKTLRIQLELSQVKAGGGPEAGGRR